MKTTVHSGVVDERSRSKVIGILGRNRSETGEEPHGSRPAWQKLPGGPSQGALPRGSPCTGIRRGGTIAPAVHCAHNTQARTTQVGNGTRRIIPYRHPPQWQKHPGPQPIRDETTGYSPHRDLLTITRDFVYYNARKARRGDNVLVASCIHPWWQV